jgi:hypothetical protein
MVSDGSKITHFCEKMEKFIFLEIFGWKIDSRFYDFFYEKTSWKKVFKNIYTLPPMVVQPMDFRKCWFLWSHFLGFLERTEFFITIKMGMVMYFWRYFFCWKKVIWLPSRVKNFFDEILMTLFFRRHLDGNTDGCWNAILRPFYYHTPSW